MNKTKIIKLPKISPFKQSKKSIKYILNQSFSGKVLALSESIRKYYTVSRSHWFYFFSFFLMVHATFLKKLSLSLIKSFTHEKLFY